MPTPSTTDANAVAIADNPWAKAAATAVVSTAPAANGGTTARRARGTRKNATNASDANTSASTDETTISRRR